jgi:hypothetical protein
MWQFMVRTLVATVIQSQRLAGTVGDQTASNGCGPVVLDEEMPK